MPIRPPIARVLFDEAHSEAWTVRPDLARAMQPAHPEDSSYARAAEALGRRDLEVRVHEDGALDSGVLGAADVLVIAHPSEPRWERTLPAGSPQLAPGELDAIEAFVDGGGGLIVLGETEQDKYGNNLNDLVDRFGVRIGNDTVSDYAHHRQAPHWILADLVHPSEGVDLLARVHEACFYRASTLSLSNGAKVLARTSAAASTPCAPLVAVTEHGAGRVVVLSDSDLFGDDCLGELDHEALWCNLVQWAAGSAFRRPAAAAPAPARENVHWLALKHEVDDLRLRQRGDGSVDLEVHDAAALAAQVERIAAAVRGLAALFAHQAAYLDAVVDDLDAWVADGFGVPDFTRALQRFRPEQQRADGIQHLVLFPMYKQNGSRDSVFEALIVGVPWPEWLAQLERTRYDNPKFVPVTLVDHTVGYDSECAVLFPETVSVAGAPVNNFGAIFCDREAARFRAASARAAGLLRLNLPPDAAALLESEQLSRDAYELWDLIHDRAHSHGDLPFDPFMIRQRMPYWMYSLEELRCDLTAFSEAVSLEREGFAFARHVQYAILFDRLFRFPITGPRVRNYDGLGGQLLFGFLHATRRLHWTDNRLTIEWEHVADGVLELRERVERLYRAGIARTKLQHWEAAHDLVSEFVPAAAGSRWAAGARDFGEVADPRPYVDEVLPDEFPLSLFYTSLQQKLAAA
ncbi:GldG family protein [Capillimicrobium parvum]|nr:GldG family protein [Capillimicrobium parvum]